jgi:hypothetical protein
MLSHDDDKCTNTCIGCGERYCLLCETLGVHVCKVDDSDGSSDSSDTSDDSDGEMVSMTLEEEEKIVQTGDDKRAALVNGVKSGSDVMYPEGGIFVNKFTGVAHQVRNATTCSCGIVASSTKFEYSYEVSALEGKKLCWRSGCASWVSTETL